MSPKKIISPDATKRQEELRALMREHRLTAADAADMMSASKRAVECWMSRPGTVDYRPISRTALDLLKLRLNVADRSKA